MHKFRVLLTGPGRGQVWIDDKPMEGVKAVSVSAAVDTMTEVKLTLHARDVEVEGEVSLDLDGIEVTTFADSERRYVPSEVA